MDQYRLEADKVIKQQNDQLSVYKDDLETEKKKQSFIIPGLAAVIGFVLGFFIIK